MTEAASAQPVIVGIDGSKAALRAALWACEEAVSRGALLRLVYAIDCADGDLDRAQDDARQALGHAAATVEAASKAVVVESETLRGNAVGALVRTSRDAQLMCLAAKGMHDSAPAHRGATAAIVAESAFCPVVIVRRRHHGRRRPRARRIVAVVDDSSVSHGVLQTALDEARRRDAPVLLLTSPWPTRSTEVRCTNDDGEIRAELDQSLRDDGGDDGDGDDDDGHGDDGDVRVGALPPRSAMATLLAQTADLEQLVIVGKDDPALIAGLVGPEARSSLRRTNCSVMVFREPLPPAPHPERTGASAK